MTSVPPLARVVLRQHRVALAFAVALFAIAALVLVRTEFYLRFLVRELGSNWISAESPSAADFWMQAIALLAAVTVGVPLVSREMENGTAAFAWTQGYSKNRWLLGKLSVVSAVLVPAAAAFGLVFGWWYRVYIPATGYFAMHAFALYAPSLAGWMLAGLTLGMAAGVATRGVLSEFVVLAGWIVLHKFVTVGSAGTPARDFWPLQFVQLAILIALAVLFTVITIWLIGDAPALAGMPRLLRAVPWPGERSAARLAASAPGSATSRSRAWGAWSSWGGVARAAWRQHRAGLCAAGGLLILVVVVLLVTGLRIHAEPAALRPRLADMDLMSVGGGSNETLVLPALLPFIIGATLGASATAREFGATAAFAWTQGVARVRWITGKLLGVSLALTVAAVVTSLAFLWWDQPYANLRLTEPQFALYPPVFAGWALACFAFGAFLGLGLRRGTAAGICLVVMLPLAVAHAWFLRPKYFPLAMAIKAPPPAGSVLVDTYVGTPAGQRLSGSTAQSVQDVLAQAYSSAAYDRAVAQLHMAQVWIYQPASHFWTLQALESAALLAIAVAFGAATIWIVSRREI